MTKRTKEEDWAPPLPAGTTLDPTTGVPRPADPADNPAWSLDAGVSQRLGMMRMPKGARAAVTAMAQVEATSAQTVSELMAQELDHLDHMIWKMRVEGVTSQEIARRLGNGMTAEQVQSRIRIVVDRFDRLSVTEMRALQVARMEGIINMLYSRMETGDMMATDMLIKVLERVNKMWELESEKMKVEVTIVNKAQTELITAVVGMVLDQMRPLLERAPENTPQIIDGVVLNVFEEVEHAMIAAQQPVPYDPKTGRLGTEDAA